MHNRPGPRSEQRGRGGIIFHHGSGLNRPPLPFLRLGLHPGMSIRPLTPKEFAAALGGLRSERWVTRQCRLWLKSKGKRGIQTLTASRYIIPGSELQRFRPSLTSFDPKE
jgi:hypothetical protein